MIDNGENPLTIDDVNNAIAALQTHGSQPLTVKLDANIIPYINQQRYLRQHFGVIDMNPTQPITNRHINIEPLDLVPLDYDVDLGDADLDIAL